MKTCYIFLLLFVSSSLYACNNNQTQSIEKPAAENLRDSSNRDYMKLKITVGSDVFTATLLNNATVAAFKAKLPITINMAELNGNEKYHGLPGNLPSNASNPGTIQAGDLMLFGSNTLVLFYKTFSTSYSYTRLGRIDDVTGLAAAVGSGNAIVTFELEQIKDGG
jgi:hypothetical protein